MDAKEAEETWTEEVPKHCPKCGNGLSIRDERGGYCTTHYWVIPPLTVRQRQRINAPQQHLADAQQEAKVWKGHHDTQVRWKRRGHALQKAHYEQQLADLKAEMEKRAPLTRCPLCHVEPSEWVESDEPGALPICEACALDVSGPVFASPRTLADLKARRETDKLQWWDAVDSWKARALQAEAERDRYREALVGLPDPSTLHWACRYCYTWNSADKEHCQECRRWAARWVGGIRIFDPEILITRSELQALVDALSPSPIAPGEAQG